MTNFQIQFTYPWLLLLLIPAVFFSLFPYFRKPKKYRRTRNRIISVVLHTMIMVLCIFALSGIHFNYKKINADNEIFLLVDVSYSGRETQKQKNEFVESVLDNGNSEYNIGIITFGYDQKYAAELSTNAKETYENYLNSLKNNMPDDSATDIAGAVSFARKCATHPETAKFVILSDGIETDGEALTAIKTAAAEGIRVDTVSFTDKNRDEQQEIQIVGMVMPEDTITVNTDTKFGVTVQSSVVQDAKLTLFDNDEKGKSIEISLKPGVETFDITHIFTGQELHTLSFEISSKGEKEALKDKVKANNVYNSYIYIEVYDKILMLESIPDESANLKAILEKDYTVDVLNIADATGIPSSLEEMRLYDQVVLVNVTPSDMPEGFEELLNTYVKELGGGLFTVGGNKANSDKEAHAYNRDELYNTTYQEMLPVLAQKYTPPLGVVIIIDCSGSMDKVLEDAKAGARACLNAMTDRDYCSVMALSDDYQEKLALTPVTREYEIVAAIDSIEIGGGTMLTPSIKRAGDALKAQTNIEKRHIIVVSDCMFNDGVESYKPVLESNYEAGITLSIVGVNTSTSSEAVGREAVKIGNGGQDNWERKYHHSNNGEDLSSIMREDLNVPEIKEISSESFTPTIRIHNAVVSGVTQEDMPKLKGYYGTKIKDGAEIVLAGQFVPIYAQWKYGNGRVGSFMCDLNGTWSAEFLQSEAGPRIIKNIISVLFPQESIREKEIVATLTEKNYGNVLNVYTDMETDERIELQIKKLPTGKEQVVSPTEEAGYTQIPFSITSPGVYEIVVQKKKGTVVVSECTLYKAFSYSQEYNMFVEADEKTSLALLGGMAGAGKGKVIEEAHEVFDDYFVKRVPYSFDPRLIFVIISIVLFLLDVAVRKFKFKWIHELIRERKEKEELGIKVYEKE